MAVLRDVYWLLDPTERELVPDACTGAQWSAGLPELKDLAEEVATVGRYQEVKAVG